MIEQQNVKPYYTFEEYLAIDEASESRYEYLHGELFAMAGSSLNHNRIALRLASELLFGLKAKVIYMKALFGKNNFYLI